MYHLETKIESQGENITLNNTAEARFNKFGISGNSWQGTGDVTDEEGNVIRSHAKPRLSIRNINSRTEW